VIRAPPHTRCSQTGREKDVREDEITLSYHGRSPISIDYLTLFESEEVNLESIANFGIVFDGIGMSFS
jgi:hypothetical protein